MIRRICTVAAVVLVALALAPAAHAQYGPGNIGVSGNTISGVVCSEVAGVKVDIFIDGELFTTVTSGEDGVFSATLPSDLDSGTHSIAAVSDGGTCVLGTTITVGGGTTPPPGGGGGALPRTGSSDTLPLARIGLSAIAVGGALVLLSRKRTSTKADATV